MGPLVVGFTGTRMGMALAQFFAVADLLDHLKPVEAHHGGCVGADAAFHRMCESRHIVTVVHWSDMPRYRALIHGDVECVPLPPLERNHHIVEDSDVLIAAPKEAREITRSGTWATWRWATKTGKPSYIVRPSGTVVSHGAE